MPALRSYAVLATGLATFAFAPAAFAGCAPAPMVSPCYTGAMQSAAPYRAAPKNVHYSQPYAHLKSVTYKQTPTTNVLRVQSRAPVAPLSQAPTQFWGSQQTRRDPMSYPPQQSYAAPAHTVDSNITQGHAYVSHNTIVHRVAPVMAPAGTVPTQSTASSTGWNQVSGPTMVDGLMATQVVCKAPEPARVQTRTQYQVVRPVIGVRYPVRVAVPVAVPARPVCRSAYGTQNSGRYAY